MDLNYIHKNEIHEKYVLGQLEDKEKKDYEAFLEINEQARRELEETRTIIEGVRLAGANSMRKEIENQVTKIRSPKTDWSLLYKAAAVLFVFVLVPSIVYFQFFDTPQKKSDYQEKHSMPAKEKGELSEEIVYEEEMSSEPIAENAIEQSRPDIVESEVQTNNRTSKKNTENITSPRAAAIPKEKLEDLSDLDQALSLTREISSSSKIIETKKRPIGEKINTTELDDVTSAMGGVSSGAGQLGKRISKTKSQIYDKISASKVYSFITNKKNVQIAFLLSDSLMSFPDSFSVGISKMDEQSIILQCMVSSEIYSLKKQDIKIEWDEIKTLNISFPNNIFYKVNLETINTSARKTN